MRKRSLFALLLPCALLVLSASAQPMAPGSAPAATPTSSSQAPAPHGGDPHSAADPHGTPPRDAAPQGNPHGGNPHGGNPHGGRQQPQQGYKPPQDGGKIDPSVPKGTIVLYLGDAFDQPVPEADVDLLIVHETVAAGKSTESKRGRTNSEGEVTFADLPYGSGHSYALKSTRGPASFEVGPMGLSDKGGIRAFLHVFDSTDDIEEAGILGRAEVQMSFKEDVIVVACSVTYFNKSPLAWIAEREIVLPPGFKALTTPDGMSPAMVPTERGAVLRGTLPPGQVELSFRYHLPLEKDGDQALRLPFLPNIVQVAVGMEASKAMWLVGRDFDPAKRDADPAGKSWLITYRNAKTRSDYIPYAELTISGLPKRAVGSWISLGLALTAAGIAAAYVISRRNRVDLPADSLADLEDAKQALLKEFVSLERARKKGEIGPKTYERVRRSMLDALASIIDQLETGRPVAARSGAFSRIGDIDVEAVFADRKKRR